MRDDLAAVRALRAELAALRREVADVLVPFASFAPQAQALVAARVADGGSPVMPSKHFRLRDFERAVELRNKVIRDGE